MLFPTIFQAQNFESEITGIAQSNQLVGVSVLFYCDNEIREAVYYGKANLNNYQDISSNTKYRIASISKAVTATALMILFDQNTFELDDPVSDFLGTPLVHPGFPGTDISFRMLLNHTSGLRDSDGYFDFLADSYNNANPPTVAQLITTGGPYYDAGLWGNQEPGIYFNYSNINFGIIATLIEKISGERFDLFVQHNLLNPLGITGSFNVELIDNISDLATLYRNGNPQVDNYNGVPPVLADLSQYEIGSNGFIFSPQGGLRVSAVELSYLMQLHLQDGSFNGQQILKPETIELLHNPSWTYTGGNGNNYYNLFNQWGLGFHRTTNQSQGDILFDNFNMIGHPGEAYGLISDWYFEKENNFGLVFLTNGYYGNNNYQFGNYSAYYTVEEAIFTAVKDHLLDNCLSGYVPIEDTPATAIQIYPEPAASFLFVEGNLENYECLKIYSIDGKLVLSMPWGPFDSKIQIQTLQNGLYFIQMEGKESVFIKKVTINH